MSDHPARGNDLPAEKDHHTEGTQTREAAASAEAPSGARV